MSSIHCTGVVERDITIHCKIWLVCPSSLRYVLFLWYVYNYLNLYFDDIYSQLDLNFFYHFVWFLCVVCVVCVCVHNYIRNNYVLLQTVQ